MSNTIKRVYIKRTSANGRVIITDHIAWDLDRFLASQQAEQRKLAKDNKPHDTITIATEAEYREIHWPKKEVA